MSIKEYKNKITMITVSFENGKWTNRFNVHWWEDGKRKNEISVTKKFIENLFWKVENRAVERTDKGEWLEKNKGVNNVN